MKKIVYFAMIIFVLWVGLTLTNPSVEDYKTYIESKVSISEESSILNSIGGYLVSEAAGSVVYRANYKVFSIYTIENPFGDDYKTLGILQMFFDL